MCVFVYANRIETNSQFSDLEHKLSKSSGRVEGARCGLWYQLFLYDM